ncbi:MAG: hypothetical protein LBB82_07410 [Treponema sp.]|nr:hypothetical protein [Treponema sp.]
MNTPAVILRRRSGWEAADLGMLLWRRNFLTIALFLGLPLGLCFALLFFVPADYALIAAVVIWVLKPLFDRFVLQVVSVRFFGAEAPKRRVFKGLGRTLRTGLAGDLLWRRFSPFRSARMPLRVLEKLAGPVFRRRREQLDANGLEFGIAVTALCLLIKSVLAYGSLAFIAVFLEINAPGFISGNFVDMAQQMNEVPAFIIITFITELLGESVYVCMGFGVYINSRVETEGWDLELLFKQLGEKRKTKRVAGVSRAALVLVMFFFFVPALSHGEEETPKPAVAAGVEAGVYEIPPAGAAERKAFDEALSSKDFGSAKQSWKIQFRRGISSRLRPRFDFKFQNLPPLGEALGLILRGAIIAALAAAAVFAGRLLLRRLPSRTRERAAIRRVGAAPPVPAALLAEAQALHERGRVREGWAHCLRAFLALFAARGFDTGGETTEYEALERLRRGVHGALPGAPALFENFLKRWIPFAYGGKTPSGESFAASVSDCKKLLETELLF